MRSHSRTVAALATAALALALAACGSDDSGDGQSASAAAAPKSTNTAAASKCGAGNGKAATGTPVRIGAIVTKQPGTDFTDITGGARAYFDCVSANGGINGRPVEYLVETEQTDPAQVAGLARKLIESEKVHALVGSISLIECAVNHKYYESKGYNIISAGIAPECYGTSNIAAVNMGARYSSMGAAQALVRKGAKKLVLLGTNVPGIDYVADGVKVVAKAEGLGDVEVVK